MSKARVPLWSTPNKFVTLNPKATEGAVFGRNLYNADGSLVTAAQFAAEATPAPKVARTMWSLVLSIPPNVTALEKAAGTGLFAVTGSGTGALREIQPTIGRTTIANGDGVAGDPTVDLAIVPNSGEGALLGITRDSYGRVFGTTDATITGTAGRVTVANGDASAGLPTIDLATVDDAGGGTLQKAAFDEYGRKTGTSAATTADLTEGTTNLYYTDERAIHAAMAPYAVADGDTFTIPVGKQCLFALPIDLLGDATLDVSGALVEVA